MSLDTLLEAAKFLEMQEMQEQQNQVALDAVLSANQSVITQPIIPSSIQTAVIQNPITSFSATNGQQPQTVVITNITPNIIHTTGTPITLAATASTVNGINLTMKKEHAEIQPQRNIHSIQNSFDIINPPYIDEVSNEYKRKPPPLVFRSGTREVHNKLEKHRRAHLKECFDILKKQLPIPPDEKKSSNLNILHSAIRYILSLKRRERELEREMERLAREKIASQNKLANLKKDLSSLGDFDFSKLIPDIVPTSSMEKISKDTEKLENYKEELRPIAPLSEQTVVNGTDKIPISILTAKNQISPNVSGTTVTPIKEVQQPVQTALSVVPVSYPINQGLVLQKLAIVPKGITELTPTLVPTFITQQQINGKVVPLVNAQYVVKPLVVVSTASPRPS